MAYIGRSITADDIIEKLQNPIANSKVLRAQIEQFLVQLQDFKIGNVISISYKPNGLFTLNLEATRPPSGDRKSLP